MKLRNKLILSCAALAAVATTAVSTTFAWYTANTEVSAEGITASTKTGSNETLLISKTGAQKSWGAKATFNMTASASMVPLEYDNGTYYEWDITESKAHDATTPKTVAGTLENGVYNDKFLSFMLYFKSGSTDNLNVNLKNITLVNTTAATELPNKTTLTETGLPSGVGTTYTVNMFRALTFATNSAASTEVTNGYAAQAKSGATTTRTPYSVHGYQTAADSLGASTVVSGYSAHQYYDAIKGTTLATLDKTNSETLTAMPVKDNSGAFASQINIGQTGAGGALNGAVDNILAVRFDIYLDGWDIACFDACQGQTFTLALEFASSKVTG